jgi:hypothetical protein
VNQTGRHVQDYNTDEHSLPGTTVWRYVMSASNTRIHQFTDDRYGKRQNMVPHINEGLTPDNVVMLYFAAIITLVVVVDT